MSEPFRRAIWRPAKGDRRSVWGWLLRIDSEMRVRPYPTLATVLMASSFVFLCCLWFLLLPGVLLDLYRSRERRQAGIEPLATIPPPGPCFGVRMEVSDRRGTTGLDDGVLTFVDNWLHYTGRRTEFSIRFEDVDAYGAVWPASWVRVGETRVTFRPRAQFGIHGEFGNRALVRRNFWDAFSTQWHALADPERGDLAEVSVLPPRELHPWAIAVAWQDLLGLGLLSLYAALLFNLFLPAFLALALIPCIGPIWRLVRLGFPSRKEP